MDDDDLPARSHLCVQQPAVRCNKRFDHITARMMAIHRHAELSDVCATPQPAM
jgi:hypothetical protein